MARRYARDNRGRFAPKGTGATARGGRLKTAGGSKRQTQTMQASAAPRAGAIRGKVKRDPGAASRVGQSGATPIKRTPRQKARSIGAMRVPASQSPGTRITSLPKGTIGTTGKTRDLARVNAALARQPVNNPVQIKVADIFRGGGVTSGVRGTQARRAIITSPSRVSGVFTRAVYPASVSSKVREFQARQKAAFDEARRNQVPRKKRKT